MPNEKKHDIISKHDYKKIAATYTDDEIKVLITKRLQDGDKKLVGELQAMLRERKNATRSPTR